MTPLTWLGPFVFFGLHILINLLNSHLRLTDRLYQALLFTIAVEITTVLHAFGHILSGKMVHSAMDELLITATRDVNLYHGDQSLIPGYVHLVRSLGGPILNLFVAGLCSALAMGIAPWFLVCPCCQPDFHQPVLWLRWLPPLALCGWRGDLA